MAATLSPGRNRAFGALHGVPDDRGVAVLFNRRKLEIPTPDQALKGRAEQWFSIADRHRVLDAPVVTDESNIPAGDEVAVFGLGCFWGAEEIFWRMPGVWSTSVGYAGGSTPHPSYEEV